MFISLSTICLFVKNHPFESCVSINISLFLILYLSFTLSHFNSLSLSLSPLAVSLQPSLSQFPFIFLPTSPSSSKELWSLTQYVDHLKHNFYPWIWSCYLTLTLYKCQRDRDELARPNSCFLLMFHKFALSIWFQLQSDSATYESHTLFLFDQIRWGIMLNNETDH